MSYTFYQVDAFTDTLFKGNPAAVFKLDAFLPDDMMQTIALENNLSETAYVVPAGDHFKLRWFTPTVEIDFCGHATVATAHVLAAEYGLTPPFDFDTKVGRLSVDIVEGRYVLDAPVSKAIPTNITEAVRAAFPVALESAFTAGNNLYLVFEKEADIREIKPDMSKSFRCQIMVWASRLKVIVSMIASRVSLFPLRALTKIQLRARPMPP